MRMRERKSTCIEEGERERESTCIEDANDGTITHLGFMQKIHGRM